VIETEQVCETSVYLNSMKQLADHEGLLNFFATNVQEIRLIMMMMMMMMTMMMVMMMMMMIIIIIIIICAQWVWEG